MKKILNNFGFRALAVLGWPQYLRLVAALIGVFLPVLKAGNLGPLDRAFNKRLKIHYRGQDYTIDCGAIDLLAQEESFTYGAIREIFIRDCYLGNLTTSYKTRFETVVDLGANRGIFSLLASKIADRVISIEGQAKYLPCVAKLASDNNSSNIESVTAMVGGAAKLKGSYSPFVGLSELLDQKGVKHVDLLKIDIEGSEFSLISEFSDFERIGAIVMEAHPKFGDVDELIHKLEGAGFKLSLRTADLEPCEPSETPDFIYAMRPESL